MKQSNTTVMIAALALLLGGCNDIFSIDNQDPPTSQLTGRVVFEGQPVGVRVPSGSAQVLLWQIEPAYPLDGSIPVYLNMSGDYSALLFDGTYEVSLLSGGGPWVSDPTRRTVVVNGNTTFDIPVQPYYTILNETITYSPSPAPGGSITATFRVGQHTTSPLVEWVGVYVNRTTFVDRTRSLLANNVKERTRAQVQTQLNNNSDITITVNLPTDIHVTPSPDRRNSVFVRVGVKTVGVSEMAFSQVYEIPI